MDSRRNICFQDRLGFRGEWKESGLTELQKRKKKKSCVKVLRDVTENIQGSPECSSSCRPQKNHSWKGKQCVWPLKWSQGWKPQVDWTLAAVKDPVVVAREEGWPVELLRTEKEDAQPEKEQNGKINKWQNPAALLFSGEPFKLCDLYWLQHRYW